MWSSLSSWRQSSPGARMDSSSVCEAIAAAAFAPRGLGGSPIRRSVLADGAPTGSRCRDAVGRAHHTAASLKPGAIQSGRSARRAVEPLGEFDDQAFGSADVAEEEHVLEVDDLPDRFPAGLSDAVDDATYVVDLEDDVPEPRTVRGRRQLLSAGGRRVEEHHLEHVAAVGAPRHHDLDRHVLETDDPIDPLAAEHRGLAAVEAEQRKKPDCLVKVLDDKSDVDEVGDAGSMAVH
jgi:hypothetical protein